MGFVHGLVFVLPNIFAADEPNLLPFREEGDYAVPSKIQKAKKEVVYMKELL